MHLLQVNVIKVLIIIMLYFSKHYFCEDNSEYENKKCEKIIPF